MDLRRNGESMARKRIRSSCAICKASNLASICAPCVNFRLNEYSTLLRSLKNVCDPLYSRLDRLLVKKRLLDDQVKWRATQTEKLKKLKYHLTCLKMRLVEEKAKVAEASKNLRLKYDSVDLAFAMIKKHKDLLGTVNSDLIYTQRLAVMAITAECQRRQSVIVNQICMLFPMCQVSPDGAKDGSNGLYTEICNARLPRGLDLDSVSPDELAASLGYMVQLLNLIAPNLAAIVLHSSGFAGSCSRIWQRDSYWDARPSLQGEECRLFLPRQNVCSFGGENSWSDRSFSNFGLASVELERKPYLLNPSSTSLNYSFASQHSLESQKDLQKGISLLKNSVACITANCYNYLGLDVPSEASTFEAFGQLLAILSSSSELQSTRNSLRMTCSRPENEAQQLNGSVWNVNSVGASSSSLPESSQKTLRRDAFHNNSGASFHYSHEMIDNGGSEILEEEWDLVEHPTLPPTPSQAKKIGHWIRAMLVGSPKK